jgi:formamidopyrimidine-DNA glycosylase
MPELPEVETIRLGLQKYLVGHKIVDAQIKIPKMFSGNIKDVLGAKIIGLKRIGKGLIIELDNGSVLAVHLKMTGQLVYSDSKTKNLMLSAKVGGPTLPSKYSHIIFTLDNNAYLYYNDLRQFGWIKVIKKDEVMQLPFFRDMGPEPLRDLTLEKLKEIITESNLVIKVLLMDQKKIGGIGNIYANDSLYKAKIDPRRKAKTLSENEIKRLFEAILSVLQKSLDLGGSSDENFVNALGQEGNYQKHALAYGREGEKCPCGGVIRKVQLGGRGTYLCANCQK